MERSRANLGFDDALAGFDPSDWAPDPVKTRRARPATEAARQVAEKTGFKSREAGQGAVAPEPSQPAVAKPVRRRRTGRNAQFNLKAKPETIAAFCAVADQNGWGLGETLEYAVSLLERDYGR